MDNSNSSTTARIPNDSPSTAPPSGTRDTPAASNTSILQNSTPSANSRIALFTNAEIPLNPERLANIATTIDEPTIQKTGDPRPRKKLKGTAVNIAPLGSRPPPAVEKGKQPMPPPPQPNEPQAQTPLSRNSSGPSRPSKSQLKSSPDDKSGEPSNPPEPQAKPPLDRNGGESSKHAITAKDSAYQEQQLSEKRKLLNAVEEIRADLDYAVLRLQDLTVSISQLKEDDEDDKGGAYWKELVEKVLVQVEKGDMEMLELRGRATRAEARVKELESVKNSVGCPIAPTLMSDVEPEAAAEDAGERGNEHRA